MNIGDKVRLLHHKGDGIITRLLPDGLVEVAIEGDFRLPVLRREVIPIAREEAIVFRPEPVHGAKAPARTPAAPLATVGIYVVLVPVNEQNFDIYFINNTDYTLPLTAGWEGVGTYHGVYAGAITPRQPQLLASLSKKQLEAQSRWVFQYLRHHSAMPAVLPAVQYITRLAVPKAPAEMQGVPVLKVQGHVFQIDSEEKAPAPAAKPAPSAAPAFAKREEKPADTGVNITALREAMMGGNADKKPAATAAKPAGSGGSSVIDLQLYSHEKGLAGPSALEPQLAYFEEELERAISAGAAQVTFVHGAGNTALRDAMQKKLGAHPLVAYFKDAQKERFGYAATMAVFK